MTTQTNYQHHHHHHHHHDHSQYIGRKTARKHFIKWVMLSITVLIALAIIAYAVYLTTIAE